MVLRTSSWISRCKPIYVTRKTLNFNLYSATRKMETEPNSFSDEQVIKEGQAEIKTGGKVFYNPVQEFNRDLSLTVLSAFAKIFWKERRQKSAKLTNETIVDNEPNFEAGIKQEDGIYVLEALSATGLRSIRYAKEVPGIKEIVANDISIKAVEDIKRNVANNKVEHLVTASRNDASMVMYQHRKEQPQFDAIDLDPYGCPSTFLDAGVQSIADGGLLLVTATDMAVLAGNSPETCYSKYGSISLKIKCCHEMALRILLRCIESHANRYGRYIVPLLSLSADFYIRVFVRVYSGASKCKHTLSKLSTVYRCTGCDSFVLQPLGTVKNRDNKPPQFGLPTGPVAQKNCEHCHRPHHIGGPIWSAPIHCLEFVDEILKTASDKLGTYERILGMLSVVREEVSDCPLYYSLEKLCGVMHVEIPPILSVRSAILNAGYRVSFAHTSRTSIKTDAPAKVIWDIMRCWQLKHPVSQKRLDGDSPAKTILSIEPEKKYSFENHPEANPQSRKLGYVRFQENPQPYWGPGTRATAMVGDQKITKSKKNQNKRKRETSVDS